MAQQMEPQAEDLRTRRLARLEQFKYELSWNGRQQHAAANVRNFLGQLANPEFLDRYFGLHDGTIPNAYVRRQLLGYGQIVRGQYPESPRGQPGRSWSPSSRPTPPTPPAAAT